MVELKKITSDNVYDSIHGFVTKGEIIVEDYDGMIEVILSMIKTGYCFVMDRDLLRDAMESLTYMYAPSDDMNRDRILQQFADEEGDDDDDDEEGEEDSEFGNMDLMKMMQMMGGAMGGDGAEGAMGSMGAMGAMGAPAPVADETVVEDAEESAVPAGDDKSVAEESASPVADDKSVVEETVAPVADETSVAEETSVASSTPVTGGAE
jgi:hypothetical protein